MADQSGPRCGNNPHARLTPGDRKVLDDFRARLALEAAAKPHIEAAAWVDGDPLMEVIAVTLWKHCARDDKDMPQMVRDDPRTIAAFAAAVARAETEGLREKHKASIRHADKVNGELMAEVQRYAEGTEQPVLWSVYNAMHLRAAKAEAALTTLAALFEGFGRLLATSSRDWGQYAPDAWLWAVICGWDCEETEHDETCTHGAMEEMQQRHGWSGEAVERARRYRAAVRALTESAPEEEQRDLGRRQAAEEPQP